MKILILNWRDIKNPSGGGAEILTHEIAKRWVKWGHKVTQISAGFEGGKKNEVIDGVKIIRLGNWWTVHLLTIFYYWKNLKKQSDIIIDEVHWFPFFAGVYARKKTVLLACEVANKNLFVLFPYPIAYFWRFLEKIYLQIYKDLPTLAISPSTKEELIKGGFKKEKITVLPMGLTIPAKLKIFPKEISPTLIYLGRLNKLKGAEDAIKSFKIIKQKILRSKMWFVGSGLLNYERKIKQKVADYHLNESVRFFGFVSEKKKFELLLRAHILVVPSVHEGWGLVVHEANSVGTPAIAYNSPGLCDIVKNGKNGLLCSENTPEALSEKVIGLLKNKSLYKKLQRGGFQEVRKCGWGKTAKTVLAVIDKL